MLEWRQAERPLLRALVRELAGQPDWELVLLRTRALGARPRAAARTARPRRTCAPRSTARAAPTLLREAAVFVPAFDGCARVSLEARPPAPPWSAPPGATEQPELAAAEAARLIDDDAFRARRAGRDARSPSARASARSPTASRPSTTPRDRAAAAPRRRRAARGPRLDRRRPAHAHELVARLLDRRRRAPRPRRDRRASARSRSPTTTSSAARSRRSSRRASRKLIVIPGEEVKTDDEGEVIGLFLKEEIPRGMSFAETVEAIRAQGGLVYVPHPFDRLHAIPSPRRCTATWPRSTSSRSTTPAAVRSIQRRGRFASRASTTSPPAPAPTRTCSRASGRGPCGCAASTARRSSSSRSAAPRSCAARSRSRTCRASSGWPRPRKGCADREPSPGLQ